MGITTNAKSVQDLEEALIHALYHLLVKCEGIDIPASVSWLFSLCILGPGLCVMAFGN